MPHLSFFFFFFNDTATTEIYTLSLHDALPICTTGGRRCTGPGPVRATGLSRIRTVRGQGPGTSRRDRRSEEHTSELQSPCNLVCRLLLEKKKTIFLTPHRQPPLLKYDAASHLL